MKRASCFVVLFMVVFSMSMPAGICNEALVQQLAARMDALEQANAGLVKELAAVKADNQGLRNAVTVLKNEVSQKETSTPINYVTPADEKYKGKNFLTSADPNFIKLYGFIKGDIIYNDSQGGELGLNAPREGTARGEDDEMHLNIRDTRVGLDITGPSFAEEGKIKGKIEFDFWGSNTGDGDTSPNPRIRLAYVDLIYGDWDLRAGQDWDFFAPLNPSTLTFSVLWRAGNMGDRHPALVLGRNFHDVLGGELRLRAGVLEASNLDANDGWPVAGGHASYANEVFGRPYTIQMGGIFGEQDSSLTISEEVNIWAYTTGFKLSVMDNLTLKGEGYYGSGLSAFRAGSPVGVISGMDDGKSVRSKGGWLQAVYAPAERWELTAGAGIDDVSTDGGTTALVWDYNYTHIYSVKYRIAKGLYGGLEYQRFGTKYTQQDGGEMSRIMSSIIYKF